MLALEDRRSYLEYGKGELCCGPWGHPKMVVSVPVGANHHHVDDLTLCSSCEGYDDQVGILQDVAKVHDRILEGLGIFF